MSDPALRIDKFLWFARLVRTRSAARALAEGGHIRLDGRRVERAHLPVRFGSVLSLPHGGRVRVVRVEAIPARRGPFPEARGCYREIVDETKRGGLAAPQEGAHAP